MIYQLCYISYSSQTHEETLNGMGQLMDISVKNNQELNVTGMLLYRDGIFMQLIEGNKDDILRLFGKIVTDSRHNNISTVFSMDGEERVFPHWSMLYKQIESGKDWALVNDITNKIKCHSVINESDIKKLIKMFYFYEEENQNVA
jgi:hypothetical protein